MNFTENFIINAGGKLLEVKGKKYDNKYAIVYNHQKNKYEILHIPTGSPLSKGFNSLEECISNADYLIKKGNRIIELYPEILRSFFISFSKCKIN